MKEIVAVDKPAFIYDFGDYDAAGWFSSEHINDMLTDYAAKAGFAQPIAFERVALHAHDIIEHGLPTRDSKERDDNGRPIPSAPAFRAMQERVLGETRPDLIGQSCELDALDPDILRGLIENRGRRHLSDERLAELEEKEAVEKAEMLRIADRLTGRR